MKSPFIIYALPRSRTNWLSHFLSYGDWKCYHEQSMFMRSADDLISWVRQDNTGLADTAAAPAWPLIQRYRPDVRVAVVRRPVMDVFRSLLAINLDGVGSYDQEKLFLMLRKLDRALDRIEREAKGALVVSFADLAREQTCAALFEHCLPYAHDRGWWERLAPMNLQCNTRALLRYRFAHRPQMDRLKSALWAELRRLRRHETSNERLAA